MENYLLNLIINIALMAFAIFSITELIYDESINGSLLRKIKPKGWILILFAFLSIVFNLYRDWSSDLKQAASDIEKSRSDSLLRISQIQLQQLQLSTKDSIIKEVKNTYTNSIKASNEALAKYSLKITDSLHSVVSKLKLDAVHPQLLLAPLESGKQSVYITEKDGKNSFVLKFISNGGTSYNIYLSYYIIKDVGGRDIILKSGNLFEGKKFITDNVITSIQFEIEPDLFNQTNVVVFITGSFTKDPEANNLIPYDYAFRFNIKDNIFMSGLELPFDKLKQSLNIN